MRGLSQAAIKAMYSSETEEAIILLLTVYDPKDNKTEVLHLADNFTQRLDQYTTDTDVVYGVSVGATSNLGSVDVQSSDYNGTTSPLDSYFKINGVSVNYSLARRGHTVMVINPGTFVLDSINTYDTYGLSDSSQQLKAALEAIPAGKLVCIGSWNATSLDQSTRDYINQQFYTTRTETWTPQRITHTVIGVKGNRYVTPIEVITAGSAGFLSHFILNSAYNNATSINGTSAGYTTIWTTAELLINDSNIVSITDSGYCDFLNQYGVWVKDVPPPPPKPAPPVINSLTWSPTTIIANGVDTATFSWNTSGGNSDSVNILISSEIAPITGQPAIGSYVVGPYSGSSTVTGEITVTGPGGTTTSSPINLTVKAVVIALNTSLFSTLSYNTFSSNNPEQTIIELTFYNSGRLTLTAYDNNVTPAALYPGGNIDSSWIFNGGSTPGNNYWLRVTRLVGSLNVTPTTGWIPMTKDIKISATGYPTFGQEGKWSIEIAKSSTGSDIVGKISNMKFLPGAFILNSSPG